VSRGSVSAARGQHGMTLVELMVAMLIGLLIVGGATATLLANRQTYRINDNLARVQEAARVAFELMARDLRGAGGTGCARGIPTMSVLLPAQGAAPAWWSLPGDGIRGFDGGDDAFPAAAFGGANGARMAGTDAIVVHGPHGTGLAVEDHNPPAAQFRVNRANHGIRPNDVLMVCDYQQASIFQATNANQGNRTIVHNTGAGSIGNCSKGLGFADPVVCTPNGTPKAYGPNSAIYRYNAKAWYIGASSAGRSLFSIELNGNPVEIAPGVHDMQITYLDGGGAYRNAAAIADWGDVRAVRITLTLRANQHGDVTQASAERMERVLAHNVTLRNRLP
jgi:type IV pilus assembly protein PilW